MKSQSPRVLSANLAGVENYDLLQTGRRLRRLGTSIAAGVVMCGIVAPIFWSLTDPPSGINSGPWTAFFFFCALASTVAFLLTNFLLRRREDRDWHEPAKAVARERSD